MIRVRNLKIKVVFKKKDVSMIKLGSFVLVFGRKINEESVEGDVKVIDEK